MVPSKPDAGSRLPIRVDQDYPRRLERAPDHRRAPAVQLVLTVLKAAHRAAAHPGPSGQLLLRPVEQPAGRPALRWCQRHTTEMGQPSDKVNIYQKD